MRRLPTVTAIAPNPRSDAGGTSVTITGTNFTGATAVTFGGTAATGVTVVNATTITATTPAHAAGVVDVAVTTPGGTGTGIGLYTYVAAPDRDGDRSDQRPDAGRHQRHHHRHQLHRRHGGDLRRHGGDRRDGGQCHHHHRDDAGARGRSRRCRGDDARRQPGPGRASIPMWRLPTVTVDRSHQRPDAGGTAVTITGTNFTGATAVTFGGTAATGVTVVNATTITAVTPAHAAGVVDVAVTTPGGTGTGSGLYTYVAPPTVTAIAPTSGPTQGGTAVTITGTNFTGATAVTFGGTAATGVTVVNATTITAVTPAHAAGVVDVAVTTPGGTGDRVGPLHLCGARPTVTVDRSDQRPDAGGTTRHHHRHQFHRRHRGDLRRHRGDRRDGGQRHHDHRDHAGARGRRRRCRGDDAGRHRRPASGLYTYAAAADRDGVAPTSGTTRAAPRSPSPAPTSPAPPR